MPSQSRSVSKPQPTTPRTQRAGIPIKTPSRLAGVVRGVSGDETGNGVGGLIGSSVIDSPRTNGMKRKDAFGGDDKMKRLRDEGRDRHDACRVEHR